MQKITYSEEYMNNLYNGSDEDIHFVLNEFSKEVPCIKESLIVSYSRSDLFLLIETLHKNYAGFAYAGFPQASAQIKDLIEVCKQVKDVSEIYAEFNHLLIAIDQCHEIALNQISLFNIHQNHIF